MDLGPVVVARIRYIGSGDCDMVVDAGYYDVVRVVLAGNNVLSVRQSLA